MLSHKIRRKDKPEVAKQVSEFAWRKKYEKTGLWEIIPGKTLGKPAGAPLPPQLPPTQFAPPQVVQLRAGVQSVEASASPVDPIGISETEPVIQEIKRVPPSTFGVSFGMPDDDKDEQPDVEIVNKADLPEVIAAGPKKRGRPKKVEA